MFKSPHLNLPLLNTFLQKGVGPREAHNKKVAKAQGSHKIFVSRFLFLKGHDHVLLIIYHDGPFLPKNDNGMFEIFQ